MNLKKIIFILCMLLLPIIVNAEECDISKIYITTMKQNKIEGTTQELNEPNFQNTNLNLYLKMHEVGDSISYDITLKNDSKQDYMIDENTFKTDSEYIEYTLKTNDGNNVIKANNSKEVTLIVEYKKEIDESLLNDDKYDASNNLKLSLKTSEKEKELDTITTNNIKTIKNPLTNNLNANLILLLLLILTITIYFKKHNKKIYIKSFLLFICVLSIPTIYAICKTDIEVESIIEIEKKTNIFHKIAFKNSSCNESYLGLVTDEPNKTVRATNVYFNKCENERHVIFAGLCWEVIRSTQTGGVKIIYNGEPVDGMCGTNRPNHMGLESNGEQIININDNSIFGSSFTYNNDSNMFTLVDTKTDSWNNSTYNELIGKYTCNNTSNTCDTLNYIDSKTDDNKAKVFKYQLTESPYLVTGHSSIHSSTNSPAYLGYMYNKIYPSHSMFNFNDYTFKYASDFEYDSTTNTYRLKGNVVTINDWQTERGLVTNEHYTCWNNSETCTVLKYATEKNNIVYYFELENGKDITDILEEMLHDDNVNKYDSILKAYLERWYHKNLKDYSSKIENTVYCNNRDIKNLGAFSKTNNYNSTILELKEYSYTRSIECPTITDQYSVDNNKAKQKYPIGLLSTPEAYNTNGDFYKNANENLWFMSPVAFWVGKVEYRYTKKTGEWNYGLTSSKFGIKPVISLNSNNRISGGTGSKEDPWIIE